MSSQPQMVPCQFRPVTLEGSVVLLVPLTREHVVPLWQASKSDAEEIFRWFPWAMQTQDDFARYIDRCLGEQQKGLSIGFATTLRESGEVVGSTRFMAMDSANRRVEIGSTWIIPAWQRSAVNSEAKYLMLRHAFEQCGCVRVEFKTDLLNRQSRTALAGLGAKEEGTLRRHMMTWTGRIRDSVYFSILDGEWPAVKSRLESRLARRGGLAQHLAR